MFRHKFLSMVILAGMLITQAVPPAMAATLCDSAQFVSDITVPDGSTYAPGATFTKTWRLLNNGTCPWTTSYQVIWAGGDPMNSTSATNLPVNVPSGQMLDLSVSLAAPAAAGHYRALFRLSNPSGGQFGIGDSAGDPFWVDINVVDVNAVIYDFVANAPYAQWKSGAGLIPFPGTSGDSRGYASQVNSPHLEDDSFDTLPGLLTVPQNKYNGYVQAAYPEFQVQSGDRLQTLVNCEYGASGCYVTFRIDYVLPNGVQKTFWSWKEAADKRFYRANLDLTPLAGQRIKFVFMLLSSGFAGGDRAIWGSPRIIRAGTVQPPAPPPTLTPLPPIPATATALGQPPPTIAPTGCDRASFVADVTVQDGTIFAPGAAFTKTWRLKNSGSCVWTPSYKLVYYSGELMGAPTMVNLPWGAASGSTVDISVNMIAPSTAGGYRGFWILANANGQFFGIGADASNPVWVEINVAGESPANAVSYDFLANACSAQWKSGAGLLPCPGTNGDSKGFALGLNPATLEDGSASTPGLLTSPQNRYNGYIQGYYPAFTVQPGDKFETGVSCEYGASCYVTFRLDYMTASGYIGTFWQRREQSDGRYYSANVDLTPLAGRSVRFILTVLATGSATNDRAVWSAPRITRVGGTPPPTITPLPEWFTYTNQQYGFQFRYPPQSQIVSQSSNALKMELPFTQGTNLAHKYLEALVTENATTCRSPLATRSILTSSETVVINGISFLKETGGDAAAGNHYEWIAYSTQRNNACISMDFVLHSLNGMYPPPPVFDKAAESTVFTQMMSTFAWLTPQITVVPPSPTFTPTPITSPGTVVPSPLIRKLFMQDAVNGWAIGDAYVLRTTDGGATWYNVSALGIAAVKNAFFQNSTSGWVIASLAESGMTALFRTTTGGSTWTSYGNVPFTGGFIQFLDNINGFVLAGEPSGMQKHAVQLYQTSDGGATWALKYANDPSQPNNTLPFSGHKSGMSFRDPSTGWVGGDYPSPGYVYLFKTMDSGVTWTQQNLSLPTGYESAYITTTAPTFFGANDAVLPVWMTLDAGKRDLYLYVTHDGGTTWTRSSSFARNGETPDFASVQDAFSWNAAGYLHVTDDSGASWGQLPPNVNFGDSIRDMDFVSKKAGWMLDVDGNGNTALYRTTDGGSIWILLYSTIPIQTLPDLTIIQMNITLQNPSCFTPGDQLGVRVWIRNNGQTPTGSFVVRVNNVDQTVNGLGIGETVAVFFPGSSMDVTAIVDATGMVAESDENNNTRSEMVPIPTQPLPCATPTFTPTPPVTLSGPYAVARVTPNDILNIRSGPGSSSQIVGWFPPDATGIMRTGATAMVEGAEWVEVQQLEGGLGWVNSFHLTEYVTNTAFCADTRIPILIEQLKGSMDQSNGDMFASLIGKHGVAVNFWRDVPPVNYTSVTSRGIFADPTTHDWGSGPAASPTGTVGTFAQVVQPDLVDVFNSSYQLGCDDPSYAAGMSANPWPHTNIHYYSILKPPTPNLFDWKVWLIGFEYVDGVPYIYGTLHYVWEP